MVETLQPSLDNPMTQFVAAVDLGASSGRVCLGWIESGKLKLEEIHRFAHEVISNNGDLTWQWDHIVTEVLAGLKKAKARGEIAAVGVDCWAVDYGLLDRDGKLISTPHCYRDPRTDIYFEKIKKDLTPEFIYGRTGIQFLFFNTLYQLAAELNQGRLGEADKFLMLPDLLNKFLCGSNSNEITNASTTQLLNAKTREWDWELIDRLSLPRKVFPPLHQPGSKLGVIQGQGELDGIPVIAFGSHDTASAVAGIPMEKSKISAYISSGTWSLVGLELKEAITDEKTFKANITNELGVENRVRFIKNVSGLWLIEESIRYWRKSGHQFKVTELIEEAKQLEKGRAFIDASDPKFTKSGPIPEWIIEDCKKQGGFVPSTPAEIALIIFESLAKAYKLVIKDLESSAGIKVSIINIVGGGSANDLLNQLTANATGLPVISGPTEATALGNLIVQFVALGLIKDLDSGRELIKSSITQRTFLPER